MLKLEEPVAVCFAPFTTMDCEQIADFEAGDCGSHGLWPEVGSRALARFALTFPNTAAGMDLGPGNWIIVQPGQYRYRVEWGGGFRVQMVFREYLAAKVGWTDFSPE